MPTNSLRMLNPQNTEANSRHPSPQKPLGRPKGVFKSLYFPHPVLPSLLQTTNQSKINNGFRAIKAHQTQARLNQSLTCTHNEMVSSLKKGLDLDI